MCDLVLRRDCMKQEERCPAMRTKRIGDETFDLCEENEMRLCDLWTGGNCDTWNEIQKEWANESEDNSKV